MNNIWTITRKELKSFFTSPIGYIVLSLFSMLAGWFFFNHLNRFNSLVAFYQMSQQPDVLNQINLNQFVVVRLFQELLMLLSVFLPGISMRLFAEEKKQKTIELLFTSPVHTYEIILGKYFSVIIFLCIMLGLTAIYPLILFIYGSPGPELAPIITGYIGLFFVGACILSIGVFASSITENQIIAFASTLSISLLFYIIGLLASAGGPQIGELLTYLSLKEHFNRLAVAFIDTRTFVYFLSFIFVWLFLTYRAIEGLRK
ncbi:MAG: ABC transporter permease subunit [Candidatus Firestonebacteria bacterium]